MSAPERLRYDLVQVAPWRGTEAAFADRLQTLGWELPAFGHLWSASGRLACSVRPGRWLLATEPSAASPVGTLAALCETAIAGTGAVTDLSAARSAWRISGPQARARLSAGCRLDLDPAAFPTGRATVTLIAQVPVFIASMDDGWLLMAPSSMTEHLEGWLHHAISR